MCIRQFDSEFPGYSSRGAERVPRPISVFFGKLFVLRPDALHAPDEDREDGIIGSAEHGVAHVRETYVIVVSVGHLAWRGVDQLQPPKALCFEAAGRLGDEMFV
jgi:hypothetical protein